jgi:hypothetical protein
LTDGVVILEANDLEWRGVRRIVSRGRAAG